MSVIRLKSVLIAAAKAIKAFARAVMKIVKLVSGYIIKAATIVAGKIAERTTERVGNKVVIKRVIKTRAGRGLAGVVAVVSLVLAGMFLPGAVASGRDRSILGQVQIEPLDDAEVSDYVNISMVDKVSLLGPLEGVTLVPLKTGAVYDQQTIRGAFVAEQIKLNTLGYLPRPVSGQLRDFRADATLRIQNDAPSINMIVWEIRGRMETVTGVYYFDDQTGKILGYNVEGSGFDWMRYNEKMVSDWAAYLGAEVKNIRKRDQDGGGDIWLFELSSGANAVSGQISCVMGRDELANRWSLGYLLVNEDKIIARD